MTAAEFRALALSFPGTTESAHHEHPDFRVRGKVFASLGYPDAAWGMVKLRPEQQKDMIARASRTFRPCAGAWGARGFTNVQLLAAEESTVRAALALACENIAGREPPAPQRTRARFAEPAKSPRSPRRRRVP